MSESVMAFAAREYDYLACTGPDAVDLLGRISTGDLRPLHGAMTTGFTSFTSNQGKMLDWCVAIQSPKGFILRCSKGRGLRIKEWVEKYIIMEDAAVSDVSNVWKSFIVKGVSQPETFGFPKLPEQGGLAEAGGAFYLPCLPAMSDFVDVMIPSDGAQAWAAELEKRGASALEPSILERARILAGVPSSDYEFAKDINPLELRLADTSICFDKGCYIGQEILARMRSRGRQGKELVKQTNPVEGATTKGKTHSLAIVRKKIE